MDRDWSSQNLILCSLSRSQAPTSSSLGKRSSKLCFGALSCQHRTPLPWRTSERDWIGKRSFRSVRSQAGAWERVGAMDRQTPLILADVSDFFPVFLEFEFWAVVSVMTLNALGFGNF